MTKTQKFIVVIWIFLTAVLIYPLTKKIVANYIINQCMNFDYNKHYQWTIPWWVKTCTALLG